MWVWALSSLTCEYGHLPHSHVSMGTFFHHLWVLGLPSLTCGTCPATGQLAVNPGPVVEVHRTVNIPSKTSRTQQVCAVRQARKQQERLTFLVLFWNLCPLDFLCVWSYNSVVPETAAHSQSEDNSRCMTSEASGRHLAGTPHTRPVLSFTLHNCTRIAEFQVPRYRKY